MNFISSEGMEQLGVSRETDVFEAERHDIFILLHVKNIYVCLRSFYLWNFILLRIFIEGIEIKFKDEAFLWGAFYYKNIRRISRLNLISCNHRRFVNINRDSGNWGVESAS